MERIAVMELRNHVALTERYGAQVANSVEQEVLIEARRASAGVRVQGVGPGLIRLAWPGPVSEAELARLVERLHAQQPLAQLEATWVTPEASADAVAPLFDAMARDQLDTLVADARVAGAVRAGLLEGELRLVFEPVRSVQGDAVLYHACVPELPLQPGVALAGEPVRALERVGLAYCLDRYVVRRALQRLEADGELRVGVNVSAQGVLDEVWWSAVLVRLCEQPRLARRLVVELSEAAPLPRSRTGRFVRRLRAAGCQVAIDDFRATGTSAQIAQPEVIKLDRSLVNNVGAKPMRELEHMVKFAREFCLHVVVQGVETEAAWQRALHAGVTWVQGTYVREGGHEARRMK
jgi:EAL domain-containing protein (putative c-di-GMP-specific phosphodiesterase class I)